MSLDIFSSQRKPGRIQLLEFDIYTLPMTSFAENADVSSGAQSESFLSTWQNGGKSVSLAFIMLY